MHYNNSFFNEPGSNPPDNPEELHNFLQAVWTDGSHQTQGGNGYGGSVPVDYAFPGNPANANEWSMCSANLENNDRRMVMVTGPHTLLSDQMMELDLGLLTHENIDYACPDISQVENEIEILQNFYNNGGLEYNLLGPDLDFVEGEIITLDAGPSAISYSWSTGETSQTIEVANSGIYSVTITTPANCLYTDEITVGEIMSIGGVQIIAPKVYPNPTSNQVFIEFTDDEPVYITLESILGQQIESCNISKGSQQTILELNITNLPQGVYLLRFHYENEGRNLLRKLIVVK